MGTCNNFTAMTELGDKSWDLFLYELHRTSHEAITDNTEIAVSPKSLQSELTCPICLDMLTSTMTTKECLHRFCSECITTALRSGNKECPTCRKRLVSRRSLRHDPIFDALIAKLYPSREVYEKEQDELLNQVINKHQGQIKENKRPKKQAPVRRQDDDRTVENGKAAPVGGAKRPYPSAEQHDELHIMLLGRTPDRNKQIVIKCESENELPKVGHLKCFLEQADASLSGDEIKLESLEGDVLNLDDEVTVARHPSHTGVLKIIYEK